MLTAWLFIIVSLVNSSLSLDFKGEKWFMVVSGGHNKYPIAILSPLPSHGIFLTLTALLIEKVEILENARSCPDV
jgi:hypothetical protein